MGFTGTAPLVDRLATLLQQEHDTELTLINTAVNALTAGPEDFTCPSLPTNCMQPFDDFLLNEPYRMVILEGPRRDGGPQHPQYEGQGSGGRPRIDLIHSIRLRFITMVNANDLAGKFQAYRICDRHTMAGRAVLMRYPKLSVPAPGNLPMYPGCVDTKISSDMRGAATGDQNRFYVVRELGLEVRVLESRS